MEETNIFKIDVSKKIKTEKITFKKILNWKTPLNYYWENSPKLRMFWQALNAPVKKGG